MENIKCINEQCPITEHCKLYNARELNLIEKKCEFFIIHDNHIGCDNYTKL